MIAPERVESFLQKLPVDALWGVGPVTARRLRAVGIDRLVDVRTADEEVLRGAVGSSAEWLRKLANGIDDRAVETNRERKSIGCEETYAKDLVELERVRDEISTLAEHAAAALGRRSLSARTVVLKLRYATFQTITRSETRRPATRSPEEIRARALTLIEKTEAGKRPVRLLGVSLHGLEGEEAEDAADGVPPALPIFDGKTAPDN